MSSLFGSFDIGPNDLDKPFPEGKEVMLKIVKFETDDWNARFDCTVLGGEHNGLSYELRMRKESTIARERKAKFEFYQLFFTMEQMKDGAEMDRIAAVTLVGKTFACKPSYREANNGNVYTTMLNYRLVEDGEAPAPDDLPETPGAEFEDGL